MAYMKDSTGRRLDTIAVPSTSEVAPTYRYDRLLPWFAALANASRKRANILMFGDSIVMGYGLSLWGDTLPSQLQAALRARNGFTSGGRGYIGANGQVGANHSFWPLQVSGGATYGLGYGPNDYFISFAGAGQKVTLTLSSSITSFDLTYYLASGGTAAGGYYKIDGGTAVTFNTLGTPGITTVRISAAANASIEIGWNAGATWSLCGVTEYKGDENSGIQVHNCGVSGTTAKNWNDYSATGWAAAQKSALNPDLVVLNLGTNDGLVSIGNFTSAAFKTNLLTTISRVRAQTTAPIVLNATYDAQNGAAAVEPWSAYVSAMRDIEASDSTVVLIDHTTRMPAASATDPNALYNHSAMPHASPKGYALMAATLAALLSHR